MEQATGTKMLSDLCKALGHEHRMQIVQMLAEHPVGLNVSDLQAALDIPWSTLSHHVDVLARAGVVTKRRAGREQLCTFGADAIATVQEAMADLLREAGRAGARGGRY